MKKAGIVFCMFLILCVTIYPQTWSAPKRLTYTPRSEFDPVIRTYSSSTVYAVWHYYLPNQIDTEIYFKKSSNNGTGWTAPKKLTYSASMSASPDMAISSGGGIYLVFEDDKTGIEEIYFKYSADGGNTWTTLKRLTYNTDFSILPRIDRDSSNNIHLVWCEGTGGTRSIMYKKSTDNGVTWGAVKRLTWTATLSVYPTIVIDSSDNIHIAWRGSASGNHEIFYKQSTNGGNNWSALRRMTYTSGDTTIPQLAAGNAAFIFLVWYDDTTGNNEIFFKMSGDNGITWSPPKRLTYTSGHSGRPYLAVEGDDNVHLVWNDDTPGNSEIFYKYSSSGGLGWTAPLRLTYNSGDSIWPVIDVNSVKDVHLIWYDYTPGPTELYYKNK